MGISQGFFRAVVLAAALLGAVPSIAADARLEIAGAVEHPSALDRAALDKLPQETAQLKAKDGTVITFRGVALWQVLQSVGLKAAADKHNAALNLALHVTASDGYQVAFSVGELDPGVGGRTVLLATSRVGANGAAEPIGDNGPLRLVVPDDKKPARSAHQIVRIDVR